VDLKETDVEKGLYRQRGGRVFEILTSSNCDGSSHVHGNRCLSQGAVPKGYAQGRHSLCI
jgi:hypothetical protein